MGGTLEITGTNFHDSQEFGDKTFTPKSPFDTFATVEFDATGFSKDNGPCDWLGDEQISLSFTEGGERTEKGWSFCSENQDMSSITLTFLAIENGQDFEIHFPGGDDMNIEIPKNYDQ
jgi:hypothetical protein